MVPRKNRDSTGVFPKRKQQEKHIPKYHGAQRYCVFCKKSGMPERKCMLHSSEDVFGKAFDQNIINDGLVGSLGTRADDLKQYEKSKHKWKIYIKAIKKQNKLLYSIVNNCVSRSEPH